jgi:hypothetical protein
MNIMVFDTETTNLEKPFCYNIGYVIFDTERREIVAKRDFVVEQVWHNSMLFTTAYYADKREIYVGRMKARKCIMDKFGYKGDIYDILFYNPDLAATVHETEKDKKFRIVETAVSANSSASKNANYIAIKGGTVGETHGDLDAGTFVLDSMGERWVMDLGSDLYTLDGYFEWSKRSSAGRTMLIPIIPTTPRRNVRTFETFLGIITNVVSAKSAFGLRFTRNAVIIPPAIKPVKYSQSDQAAKLSGRLKP